MGVGVNNLRVIQLSETCQVAADRTALRHRHGRKQLGVGVGDTVATLGSGIAESGFVIVCRAHRRKPFVRASLQCKRHAGNTANRFAAITGCLFAVVVVIPLKYPRANQCSRTIGGCAIQWTSPDYLLFIYTSMSR